MADLVDETKLDPYIFLTPEAQSLVHFALVTADYKLSFDLLLSIRIYMTQFSPQSIKPLNSSEKNDLNKDCNSRMDLWPLEKTAPQAKVKIKGQFIIRF